jgi:negative regulator of sigma E activity
MLRRSLTTACLIVAATGLVRADESSIHETLRRADRARGNLEGVTWRIDLESTDKRKTTTMAFNVKARAFDISAEQLTPARSRGNKILMINRNMWFYRPGLSKPVSISRRQRLMGSAAYGDIAVTNYATDYEATLIGEEEVAGEDCTVFDLKAKNRTKTTYDRIKYWVSNERSVGIKAEYYAVSGKRFKTSVMEYANTIEIDGATKLFISRITIRDEVNRESSTVLTFVDTRIGRLDDALFNLNLLRR